MRWRRTWILDKETRIKTQGQAQKTKCCLMTKNYGSGNKHGDTPNPGLLSPMKSIWQAFPDGQRKIIIFPQLFWVASGHWTRRLKQNIWIHTHLHTAVHQPFLLLLLYPNSTFFFVWSERETCTLFIWCTYSSLTGGICLVFRSWA